MCMRANRRRLHAYTVHAHTRALRIPGALQTAVSTPAFLADSRQPPWEILTIGLVATAAAVALLVAGLEWSRRGKEKADAQRQQVVVRMQAAKDAQGAEPPARATPTPTHQLTVTRVLVACLPLFSPRVRRAS